MTTQTDPTLAHPTTAEFIDHLERRAPVSNQDEMLEVLRTLAAAVPEELRADILESLPDSADPTEPELSVRAFPELPASAPGVELVENVDAFVRRLEDGHYYEGFRWDEERREERAWGDESWAREMDELFGRAATGYLSGSHQLAARVYGRLLGTFRHADRNGVFCGPEPPDRMIRTDLSDAKRRYLRALFIVATPIDRPHRLITEMEALRNVGDHEVGIRALIDTEPDGDEPIDLTGFLPEWIKKLKAVRNDPKGWGREARRLLREAVDLHGGVDGLGKLARDGGADHPEAYHDWVGALVRADRLPEAIRAAREGTTRIRDAAYRARLADRLAALAASTGDLTLAVEATRNAWRAAPTQVRLLHLVSAAETAEMRDAVLAREVAAVLRPDWNHSDALACRLLLLVGRHEEAATRFQRADALGWGRTDHAGSVVLPFLLLASTQLPEPPRGSAIEALWKDLDDTGPNYFDRRLLLDRMSSGSEATAEPFGNERAYSELLREAVVHHPIPEVYRPRMLGVAQLKVETVVRDVLNGQHRRGQARAAQLTVSVAEAIALSQKGEDGLEFVKRIRKEYRRYSVFKDALDEARHESPILPDPAPKKQGASLTVIK